MHIISIHIFACYADNTQLYIPVIQNDNSQVFKLEACLLEVKNWMCTNDIMLNADKTELLVVRPPIHRDLTEEMSVNIDGCIITGSPIRLEILGLFLILN